jgi:hypothetical protein
MMRASGAIPSITALHKATASFAVPKSVMNTMVERAGVGVAEVAAPLATGDRPHPTQPMVPIRASNISARALFHLTVALQIALAVAGPPIP